MMKMTAPMEIGLTVRDLPMMRAFYEEALGLVVVADVYVPAPKAQQAALSASGYQVVRLQTPNGERLKLLAPDTPPATRSAPSAMILDRADASYLTFIVDDLASVVARAFAAGAKPITGVDAIEVRPGTFLSFLRDPEGHVLEIVEYSDISSYRPDMNAGE